MAKVISSPSYWSLG